MSVPPLPALPAVATSGELRTPGVADRASVARVVLPEPAAPAAEREQLLVAAEQANQGLREKGVELAIEFDDELGRAIFRLVDSRTGELVRQVPSEEMLVVARALAAGQSAGALLKAHA